MNDNDIPKRLQRAMQDAGLVNPRSDRPSLSAWKRESGVHTSTISRFVKGGTTLPANVQKMADALGVSVAELHSMTGRTGPAPWSPPQGTETLTARQRAALSELVLAFIEEDKGAAHDRQGDTQQGPEAGSTVDRSEDRREDGSEAGRRQTPMSELEQRREQRRQDEIDSANFGTKHKPGDLEDLQRRQDEADRRDLSDLTGYAADEGPFMDGDE